MKTNNCPKDEVSNFRGRLANQAHFVQASQKNTFISIIDLYLKEDKIQLEEWYAEYNAK